MARKKKEADMSYSASYSNVVKEHVGNLVIPPQTQPEGLGLTMKEVNDGVLKAIAELVKVIGRPEDRVTVSISGHCNPNHAPHFNWSNEHVTISITQTAPVENLSSETDDFE